MPPQQNLSYVQKKSKHLVLYYEQGQGNANPIKYPFYVVHQNKIISSAQSVAIVQEKIKHLRLYRYMPTTWEYKAYCDRGQPKIL